MILYSIKFIIIKYKLKKEFVILLKNMIKVVVVVNGYKFCEEKKWYLLIGQGRSHEGVWLSPLEKLGFYTSKNEFSNKWILWIHACIFTSIMFVSVNVWENSLAPFLILIAAEGLTWLVKKLVKKESFNVN